MKVMLGEYDADLADCEDVTDDAANHLACNEWTADNPDYRYDNVDIWDGGMGVNLYRDRATGRYYVND